jgi:2-phospho-L-lactate/phosphoenolpyruvate guanylyltransferase
MSVWLVLPMKSLRDGKSRLAPALDPRQRRELLEYLLLRTLDRAAEFPGLQRTLVVSGCEETRVRSASLGAQVLEETPGVGLNGALREAQLELRRANARTMLVVPCDLPLLEADDLQALAQAAWANCVAIAPDEARQGTNGLCFDARQEFSHLTEIRRLGLQHLTVENPRLAFDLDLAQDLARLGSRPEYTSANSGLP